MRSHDVSVHPGSARKEDKGTRRVFDVPDSLKIVSNVLKSASWQFHTCWFYFAGFPYALYSSSHKDAAIRLKETPKRLKRGRKTPPLTLGVSSAGGILHEPRRRRPGVEGTALTVLVLTGLFARDLHFSLSWFDTYWNNSDHLLMFIPIWWSNYMGSQMISFDLVTEDFMRRGQVSLTLQTDSN